MGCVPGDLLHADALRKTYGRCLRHNLDTTKYMKPSETWGRMPVKILSGDFCQLPPVPATASLLASPSSRRPTYGPRRPKYLKHSSKTGRGDLREAQILETVSKTEIPEIAGAAGGQQILETLCKNGPRRSPGGPNP